MRRGLYCFNCQSNENYPKVKDINFTFLNKYTLNINPSRDTFKDEMFQYFDSIVKDINVDTDPVSFTNFTFISDENFDQIKFKCTNCGSIQEDRYWISLADELYLYLEDLREKIIYEIARPLFDDDIRLSYRRNLYISDEYKCYISNKLDLYRPDLTELYRYWDIYRIINYLPKKYQKEKELIQKINEILPYLPIIGGRGGGFDVLEWMIDELRSQIFGIVLSALLLSVPSRISKLIARIRIYFLIRKKIKNDDTDWSDISFDELQRNFSIPRKYQNNKEKIIHQIILDKGKAYEKELFSKVKK